MSSSNPGRSGSITKRRVPAGCLICGRQCHPHRFNNNPDGSVDGVADVGTVIRAVNPIHRGDTMGPHPVLEKTAVMCAVGLLLEIIEGQARVAAI